MMVQKTKINIISGQTKLDEHKIIPIVKTSKIFLEDSKQRNLCKMLKEKITKLDLKRSLAIFQWSKTYELTGLYEPTFRYIERCFNFLTNDKNFLEINFNNIRKILISSQLNVDFELDVYRFAE